jgi:RNA polymerase sigma-70 factor (ECF subfamily)
MAVSAGRRLHGAIRWRFGAPKATSLYGGPPVTDSRERPMTAGSPQDEPSDRSLLQRFQRGSQDAATQLYLRYAARLRALAKVHCSPDLFRRIDVEDIVQSVFGSFFRGARQGYYMVPAGEELWRLFLVIALNKIRAKGAFHRAAKRDVRLTAGSEWLERAEAADPNDEAAYRHLHLVVEEALGRLPAQHKAMVELRIEGYEVAEIARRTGRSKRTVERILQEAREQLAPFL